MKDIEEAAYRVLSRALLAGRLKPDSPLRETALSEVFGISRERVRKLLLRLGTNRLLELVPNRGAFVAAPSLEQARAIYEARRILEGGIASHLATSLSETDAERLRAHTEQEERAMALGDRAESVRLSALFHMIMAEATGNAWVIQQMQELVSRTAMLVAMYESANATQCACDEHRTIFTSLLRGNSAESAQAMRSHLSLVETRLRPVPVSPAADTLDVLRALWAQEQAHSAPAAQEVDTASTSVDQVMTRPGSSA